MKRGDDQRPIDRRWVEQGDHAADTDARIGALLADVPPPAPLPAARLAAIAARLPGRPLPTRLPVRRSLRWALAATIVLGSASAVFARKQIATIWNQVTAPSVVAPAPSPSRSVRKRTSAPASRSAPTPPPSTETPPPMEAQPSMESPAVTPQPPTAKSEPLPTSKGETELVRPRPAKRGEGRGEGPPAPKTLAHSPTTLGIPRHLPNPTPPTPPPAPSTTPDPLAALTPPPQPPPPLPPPPAETADTLMPLRRLAPTTQPPPPALQAEAALLRRAIEALRLHRRPTDAFEAVTEHRRRFPNGTLATDAQLVRVEALIALGRRQEALVALEDHRLAGEGTGGALQVTRAELLADRDCSQAITAFADLLESPTTSSATRERALRGRAICHSRSADHAAAHRDWAAYLRHFPNGQFSAEARRGIGR